MTGKRLLSALSAAAIALSATGCSSKKEEKKQEIKEFTGFYCARNDSIAEDNDIQKIIAEKTGCILKEEWIEDQADMDKVFSDMMISGKYPDFISPDAGNCQRLIKENAFIPLDNYWDDYPEIKALYTDAQWDIVRSEDGHIYYIPLFSAVYKEDSSTVHDGEAFWIQIRVLEWANYPELKTLDDYFGLIEDYIAAHPTDENGQPFIGYEIQANDTRFFALDNPPMFLEGYPNDGCCIVDPDTLEAKDYNLLPTARTWFKKLNEEYGKGIIDPECFVMETADYYDKILTGRVLGMVDQHWNFASSERELPPECRYIPFGLTIDGKIQERYHDRIAFNASTGVGISTSCSDPEGAVKFISSLLDPEIQNLRFWGVEGVDYFVNDEGLFDQTEEQYKQWRSKDYIAKHICEYSYMPRYLGMAPDGINAYTSTNQPIIFYDRLDPVIKKCFDAYGAKTYTDFLNSAPENPPWYPMWSFDNAVTEATDYGKVMKQMQEVKHKYMPLMVMSDNFDKTWNEYEQAYNATDPQVYFDELTAEVHRRCSHQTAG
ncbi:MAG: sugar ABC transporter substrate-binding protein [Ruminococcus sp.]|nr:sugar ABC transporter substrate-binding protein [Ruminococcus sp.]